MGTACGACGGLWKLQGRDWLGGTQDALLPGWQGQRLEAGRMSSSNEDAEPEIESPCIKASHSLVHAGTSSNSLSSCPAWMFHDTQKWMLLHLHSYWQAALFSSANLVLRNLRDFNCPFSKRNFSFLYRKEWRGMYPFTPRSMSPTTCVLKITYSLSKKRRTWTFKILSLLLCTEF